MIKIKPKRKFWHSVGNVAFVFHPNFVYEEEEEIAKDAIEKGDARRYWSSYPVACDRTEFHERLAL